MYLYWIWERQVSWECMLGGPFLRCPPPSLPPGPSCSTSPLGYDPSSLWTISSSRVFPAKYMSQSSPQTSDKPFIFVCLFVKLERNFGSWGDGICYTKTILRLGSGFTLSLGRESYILAICTLFCKEPGNTNFRHCGPYGLCCSHLALPLSHESVHAYA